jgi:MraZ protein
MWGIVGYCGSRWVKVWLASACGQMKQGNPKQPSCFNSVHHHGLDEKRRIQIPARFRPTEPGIELTLVIWPGEPEGACLRVLRPEQMEKLIQDIEALPKGDPKKLFLRRFIGSHSAQVTLDSAGRILLPEEMAKAAGITEQAAIVGTLNGYEMWNPERFKKTMEVSPDLAREAFGLID